MESDEIMELKIEKKILEEQIKELQKQKESIEQENLAIDLLEFLWEILFDLSERGKIMPIHKDKFISISERAMELEGLNKSILNDIMGYLKNL